MYESAAPISGRLFLFSDSRDAKRLWSAEIHLRFQIMRKFYTRPCIASRTGRAARRVTTFECKHRRNCPEGSEHRAFGLRMAPGDVAHVPRTPSPVAEAGPVARHFRSRARLRRLLAGLRPSTLHRSLRSLRQRGFALYVRLRHYRSSLLAAAKPLKYSGKQAVIRAAVKFTNILPV